MKLDGCNALITGASAGIGREFARQLAGRARSMILVARRDERLIELADQLQREHPKLLVHIRKVDLGDPGQLQAFLERLDLEKLEVDLLINNAGLGDSGPFAESDPRSEQGNDDRKRRDANVGYSPFASANDRTASRRHSQRQFVGWLSPDPGLRCLRRHEGVCDKFL